MNTKTRSLQSRKDRWVAIAPESAIEAKQDTSKPTFVRLRNPSTGVASLYLFSCGDSQLYEVKAFKEDYHSWFIGEALQRDGRLLYITPMDPLYLLLPYLMKAGKEGKFQPVNQLVMDEDFPACTRLLSCTRSMDSLHYVTEEKEVGGQKFHRYSQEKATCWLQRKVEKTVMALRKSNVSVGEGVTSTTFIRVKQESHLQEAEDYLRYAYELISEYITEDQSTHLLKRLQLAEISSPKDTEPSSKKRKRSDKPLEAGEDYTQFNSTDFTRRPPKKMSAAQKSLAKVDKSGMKSMFSFFSSKAKQEKN